MAERPNFILFITDQHRADYLGCYGHPVLKTPHIDSLADRGVLHDKFYVASPVCMPNRASLMTCRMPSSHGVRMNGIPLSPRNVTFVEALRAAGYETALIGKSHLQNMSGWPPVSGPLETRDGFVRTTGDTEQAVRPDADQAFLQTEWPDSWKNPDHHVPTPYYGFDHVDMVSGHGDNLRCDYARWLRERRPDADSLIGADNQLPHDYVCPQAVRTALPEDLYSTPYIADRAAEWLAGRKDPDRPFFLMVSWPDPHHPFNPPGKYWDMYTPDQMDLPAAFQQEDWTPPMHVQAVQRLRETGKAQLKGMGTIAVSAQEALEARALTCGMIAMIDDGVGTVLSASDSAGLTDDTVMIFTSDHGDHLGDHRLLLKGSEQYEQLTHVPFIWADPEGPKGQRSDGIGQTIDIGTTILERARIEAPAGMQGRPLPVVGGAARDAAFIQYDHQKNDPAFGPEPRVHTIRTDRWRMSVYAGHDFGELYDLHADPDELTNLWDNSDAGQAKADLIHALLRYEIDTVDRAPRPTANA